MSETKCYFHSVDRLKRLGLAFDACTLCTDRRASMYPLYKCDGMGALVYSVRLGLPRACVLTYTSIV